MKSIKFVADIALRSITGQIIVDDKGPVYIKQHLFLLERLTDPSFVGRRQGLDAILFVIAARDEIDRQVTTAEQGEWLIEDDRAEGLKIATLTPSVDYPVQYRHCLAPMLLAVRDMT